MVSKFQPTPDEIERELSLRIDRAFEKPLALKGKELLIKEASESLMVAELDRRWDDFVGEKNYLDFHKHMMEQVAKNLGIPLDILER